MNILGLSGSIRSASSNAKILRAIELLLPKPSKLKTFEISTLPFFDPNLQFAKELPEPVKQLRNLAKDCGSILIATPEYAHGIPGILKNALEWLLCEETMKKPVAIIIGAPSGGDYVKEYLIETLRTMDLVPALERTLVIRTAKSQIEADGKILDQELKRTLQNFIEQIMVNR